MVEEAGSLQEGEVSGVIALGSGGIMVVAGALLEMTLETGVSSLVEVGVQAGVVETVISTGEGEVADQVDRGTMLFFRDLFPGSF